MSQPFPFQRKSPWLSFIPVAKWIPPNLLGGCVRASKSKRFAGADLAGDREDGLMFNSVFAFGVK